MAAVCSEKNWLKKMNADDVFSAGTTPDIVPEGDAARQAVDSLRGYAYQALAAALAWLDLSENGWLFLEVAEDYAILAGQALQAVQVKDTEGSGSVTLNSANIRGAVAAFVDLVSRNPCIRLDLRYFTTSGIGTEQAIADRPDGMGGLKYWRKVASGADPTPLRKVLESDKFPESVRSFSKARDDAALRRDLIERIHWDCGKPGFTTLRQELEERLVVIGRDRFDLPASEARRLADLLVFEVLKKSIGKTLGDRVLKRADLYECIDRATRLSVPRITVDHFMRLDSSCASLFGQGKYPAKKLYADEASWIIDGAELPIPRGMIPRDVVKSAAKKALMDFDLCMLIGGTGLGKTNVSRTVARECCDSFSIVDFRDADASGNRHLLHTVFAHIGGLRSSLLILDDLNHLDDKRVAASFGRVFEAVRRRDLVVLVTCYRKPSASLLADIGLDERCVVDCPYFSEKEAHALVLINGGKPDIWGHLAYMAGAGGHPQLTHAFVFGMAARGWPIKEIKDIVGRGLSSSDIDSARDAARRNLASELPEGCRNILYRMSLTIGRFSRPLALAVGALPPPIPQAGEFMDQLVGPWIETSGKDLYRVSPLANSFGREMLTLDEQASIHKEIAVQMLRKREIDVIDANSMLMHAIAGKSSQSLAMLAQSVLTASARNLEMLAGHFTLFSFLTTDRPIYPENPSISMMLRLAQFKLTVAASEGEKVADIAATLFNEVNAVPAGESGRALEAVVLTVLNTIGIANYLDDWVDLLHRFKDIVGSGKFLGGLRGSVEGQVDTTEANLFSVMFSIGSAGITSVVRLEHVINELDKLDESERALLLTPIDKNLSDYCAFIHGPWASQQRGEAFNAADSALRYHRMADKVQGWGIRSLALQCWVAQAVMLDEYEDDSERALEILDNAVAALGTDPIISRARAKIYWRHDQYPMALDIMRDIADQIGGDNAIERAFALREAAISAAKCNEWLLAEKWFLEAQGAAKNALTDDMQVMALGLGADAAVAAFETGDLGRALERLAEALEGLADISPDESLRAAYCHRVIRHTVLWIQSRVEGSEVRIGGQPIAMQPGACSNLDPAPTIRELPLGNIDLAWYVLAEIEAVAGLDAGIMTGFDNRLAQGQIPAMEWSLRNRRLEVQMRNLDARRFSTLLWPWIEAATYVTEESDRLRNTFDLRAPERGQIPALVKNPPFDPVAVQIANDAVLAFGIGAALQGQADATTELEAALANEFTGDFPGKDVLESLKGNRADSLNQLDQIVIRILKELFQKKHLEPSDFWMAGLRLFEKINQSQFRQLLMPLVAGWQRAGWKRITTTEVFRLSRPSLTAPAIDEVLDTPSDDRSFVARLLVVSSEAVGSRLGLEYCSILKNIAEEASP